MDLGLAVIDTPQMKKILAPRFNSFLTLSYHLDDFTPFLSCAATIPIGNNKFTALPAALPNAAIINQGVDYIKSVSEFNRHTISLGLRYDITENIDTKFQVDYSQGSTNNLLWESLPNRNFDGDSVLFGATLDFIF